ncbi:M23 family metallopeptidase [Paenibacillus sp. J22TS3]|uniref:M23 family metallopeptidase n=1 Tax=Paenibacillus sp. J22TS3 TaxID=2807192 RepID=UPI001B2976F9|nr:M23 family metallopeptidase [Paenibacillus sp. J22TS3]GIP23989.1 L-Ala--D-Glu endopeptidase [Paenibacillus sp. J22TS3]
MHNRDSLQGKIVSILLGLLVITTVWNARTPTASATNALRPQEETKQDPFLARRHLYEEIGALVHIPWYRLAAVDQYERTMTPSSKLAKPDGRLTRLSIIPPVWSGWLNPEPEDTNPVSISLFAGIGRDANGDGVADPTDDRDALYTIGRYIAGFGYAEDDFQIALWKYYQNDRAVHRISQFAKIYEAFNRLDLFDNAFPLPISNLYSYKDTWGSSRSWGGFRIHEGNDLFAPYGVPVRSVCYGIVETKGWNPFGGWRIGIRDLNNRYHYYAHLSGYAKNINVGDMMTPGKVIGWVGSSGYGPPGTQGKFPPHLHFGIYRDNGRSEWAFDPYPLLKRWESSEKAQLHKRKKTPSE